MNINELDSYNLADAVKFHSRLNPRLWGQDEHLLSEVREKLLAIAADFQEFLGVDDLNVQDITISGSNAAYSYTNNSDIDLHLVVNMPDNPVYQELFNAKKYQYNDEHNIKIGGADVELYVQPADQAHHSQGIYSIKNSDWVSVPQRKRAQVDDACVRDKVASLDARIHAAVKSQILDTISALWDKIKAMRKSGLEQHGEFGCDNIAFKVLRNSGCIKSLKDAKTALQDQQLSLRETPKKPFRYGFQTETVVETAVEEEKLKADLPSDEDILRDFIEFCVKELKIERMPKIKLRRDPQWPVVHTTFGRYINDQHMLEVAWGGRHIMDVLRTVAHELTHRHQHERDGKKMDNTAGETGSPWENEANARAGILMRDYARMHPEYFAVGQANELHGDEIKENASGYIPKNKKEAKLPQYAMALSVDIHPGQVGKEANKLGLKTGRNGEPGLLSPSAQNLLREFADFKTEPEDLFEITMSPSSLKKLSAQTGALAGMEFEMCVPNVEGNDDGDQEPDYDYDESCRSIEDAVQFFYDGDFNGRRDVERLRERMQNDFSEWLDDKIYQDWERNGEEYLEEWVPNNVDESEWNPEGLEGEERQEALEEFIANLHANPGSSDAFDEYREENQESYDESDWLDDEDIDRMSSIENAYSMNWPHWTNPGRGESSIEDVADSFRDAVGRPILASTSYHSGRVERPSARNLQYIVEPDSSIDVDDNDDQGLEFVSPPLPIEELLSDLNKVKAWADKTGCYTNDSTGLHINVSVPGWSGDLSQLDYVKLALLLGDEHVLESFGRAGNTYCKSAMGKIQKAVKQNPDKAEELLERMRQGMDQLASKAIHSGVTDKYTSINPKNGYIEFRSPGGDWLNDNFAEIDNTLRRFTVALSAAVDPEAYRKEYLKKLYKLLDVNSEKDPLSYFAKYAAGTGFSPTVLKSFIRQAQLERKVKRASTDDSTLPWRLRDTSTNEWATDSKGQGVYFDGTWDDAIARLKEYVQNRRNQGDTHNYWPERNPGPQPLWWRVYKEGRDARNGAIIEVVAKSREEAIDKAAKEWGVFSNEYRRAMYAEPLRPYVAEKGPELNGRPSNPDGNYVIVNASTSEPAYRYMASDMTDAVLVLRQWITANPGTQWDFKRDPEIRLGQPGSQGVDTSRPIPGSTLDLQRQRAAAADQYYNVSYATASGQTNNVQVRARNADAAMAQVRSDLESSGQRVIRIEADPVTNQGSSDAAQGGIIDVEPDLSPLTSEPPPQLPGMGQWNGQWRVLVGGQEVYRFGGVGNSQADANRIAAAWLRQNGQGVSGEGFEVYPVMDESLTQVVGNVSEARSHPNKNIKWRSGRQEVGIILRSGRINSKEWGLSMTMLPKLGINPGKGISEDTPKGIYFYPLASVNAWVNGAEELPWGNDFPYIQVFQYDTSHRMTPNTKVDPEKLKAALRQYCPEEIINQVIEEGTYNNDPYWFIYNCLVQVSKNDESTIVRWNKVLRDLGFTSVYDYGLGWIAYNEPEQGIILDPRIIKQVRTIENYTRKGSLQESADDYRIHDTEKLDRVLSKCCRMIERGQQKDPERYGMVAACVIDPDNRQVYGINLPGPDGRRRHAERVAIDKYRSRHGDIPPGSIVVTTLSPCNAPMDERAGESCKDLLNSVGIHKVYCGYIDPTQHDDEDADFTVGLTQNDNIWETCKSFADTFLPEADVNPQVDTNYDWHGKQDAMGLGVGEKLGPGYASAQAMASKLDSDPTQINKGISANYRLPVGQGGVSAGITRNADSTINQFNLQANHPAFGGDFTAGVSGASGQPSNYSAGWNKGNFGVNYNQSQDGKNKNVVAQWKTTFEDEVDENFADGKNPGRKGLSKRMGVDTKASVSSLRNTAKHSSGEKQRMAHWLANMKAGRAKAKRK